MGLQDLLKKSQGGTKSGGLSGLVSSSSEISERTRQAQREADAAQFESDRANSFSTLAKETIKGTAKVIPDIAKNTYSIYSDTPRKLKEDVMAGAEDYAKGDYIKGTLKTGGRVAADSLAAIIAPLSAAIGTIITATGGQGLIDKTGEKVADSTGITDWDKFQKFAMEHPNAGEDFNRILNLATIGTMAKGEINPKTMPARTSAQVAELSNKIARQVMRPTPKETGLRKLVVQSQTGEANIPLNTPKSRMAAYSKEQGYEPITPDSQLPTIQMGSLPKGDLPTIRYDAPVKSPFLPEGAKYEPLENSVFSEPKPIEKAAGAPREALPVGAKPVVEGMKPSKVATSVEGKAIEKNLSTKFNDVAMYEPRTVADQASRVASLLEDGKNRITRIVRGEETLPQGVSGSMFIKGVEDLAIKNGDATLLRELAKSPLVSDTSLYAQELRFLAERDSSSPLQVMKDISNARSKKVRDPITAKRTTVNEIKKEITKASPKKQTWESFISSIEC